jgi:hypothetical protein
VDDSLRREVTDKRISGTAGNAKPTDYAAPSSLPLAISRAALTSGRCKTSSRRCVIVSRKGVGFSQFLERSIGRVAPSMIAFGTVSGPGFKAARVLPLQENGRPLLFPLSRRGAGEQQNRHSLNRRSINGATNQAGESPDPGVAANCAD